MFTLHHINKNIFHLKFEVFWIVSGDTFCLCNLVHKEFSFPTKDVSPDTIRFVQTEDEASLQISSNGLFHLKIPLTEMNVLNWINESADIPTHCVKQVLPPPRPSSSLTEALKPTAATGDSLGTSLNPHYLSYPLVPATWFLKRKSRPMHYSLEN